MSNWEMRDYSKLPCDYVQEDKEAARKQLEEDTKAFLSKGGEIKVYDATPCDRIDEKVKAELRKSLKYYEERQLTSAQKIKRGKQ